MTEEIRNALQDYFEAVHQDRDFRDQYVALLAAITRREAEVLELAAKVCDRMVIGGRAWTHDQSVAAEVLLHAGAQIRALIQGAAMTPDERSKTLHPYMPECRGPIMCACSDTPAPPREPAHYIQTDARGLLIAAADSIRHLVRQTGQAHARARVRADKVLAHIADLVPLDPVGEPSTNNPNDCACPACAHAATILGPVVEAAPQGEPAPPPAPSEECGECGQSIPWTKGQGGTVCYDCRIKAGGPFYGVGTGHATKGAP